MKPTRKSKSLDMSLKINIPAPELLKPKITIFGVGGAGGNAINNMIRSNLEGVEFIAANTDAQALASALAPNRIQLGVVTTKGLGAGSFPDRGRAAAEEIKARRGMVHKSHGMHVTQDRLKAFELMYGKKTSLELIDLVDETGKPCGTQVNIFIPTM